MNYSQVLRNRFESLSQKKNKDFYLIKSRLKELTRVQISQVNLHKKKNKRNVSHAVIHINKDTQNATISQLW